MNDAQRRIEEQKRLKEAEELRQQQAKQQELAQLKIAEEQRRQSIFEDLRNILVKLEVERKLQDIAQQYRYYYVGEKIEITPATESYNERSSSQGERCMEQQLRFTSRPYTYTWKYFVKTGWRGATQGNGGGSATEYTETRQGTNSDTRSLAVAVSNNEIWISVHESDSPNTSRVLYQKQVMIEEDFLIVASNLDECLIEAAPWFDTHTYQRKPPHVNIGIR